MRILNLSCGAALAALMLTACGGGGGSEPADTSLASDVAQGYASDAQALPVLSATTADATTQTLEAVVGATVQASGLAPGQARALSAQALAAISVACPGGGSVVVSITGDVPSLQVNGRLDAGETYTLVFNTCGSSAAGLVLDGRASVAVAAWSDAAADFTTTYTALQATVAQGRYTLDGSVRQQRTTTFNGDGSSTVASRLSSTRLAVASVIGQRNASYELRTLAWAVERTQSALGRLLGRTHQGTLDLAASVPRRPAATLQVVTQGALTLGNDGLASSGSFSVATGSDKITVLYGSTTVDITLDLGNNGSVDRRWTLTRGVFVGEAG